MGVYVNKNIEGILLRKLEQWMEATEEGKYTLLDGDFNARTRREGGTITKEEEEKSGGKERRYSKDEKINREGRKLVEIIEDKDWSIFNGNMRGDENGQYTFTGGTVIDYVIGDEEIKLKKKKRR